MFGYGKLVHVLGSTKGHSLLCRYAQLPFIIRYYLYLWNVLLPSLNLFRHTLATSAPSLSSGFAKPLSSKIVCCVRVYVLLVPASVFCPHEQRSNEELQATC